MQMNYKDIRRRHPWLFGLILTLKRIRTKVAFLLVLLCVVRAMWHQEQPFNLDEVNVWALLGWVLIVAGVGLRLAAYGCITKKESLATTGVYSLCRHPLYLGSVLLAYGFLLFTRDSMDLVVATAYFAIFYSLVIVWEEIRLAERYGEAHRKYCQDTPLILPIGHFKQGIFLWNEALRSGGGRLLAAVVSLLVVIEVMAETMRAHWLSH